MLAATARASAKGFDPRPDAKAVYDELYRIYRELHDAFGLPAAAAANAGARPDLGTLMKRLLALKERTVNRVAAV